MTKQLTMTQLEQLWLHGIDEILELKKRLDKPLFIVMSYDKNGNKGILAVKATKDEAEAVQAKWSEIVESSDIEEWGIGDELEPER